MSHQGIEHYYQSLKKYEQRAYETSLELVNQAILEDENNYAFYYHRGTILQQLQQWEEALQDFTQVIYWNIGRSAYFLEKFPQIRNQALLAKIKISFRLKNYQGTIKDAAQLIAYQRNDWHGFFYRGLGHYFSQSYPEALDDLEMALYLTPQKSSIRCYRGLVFFQTKQYEAARLDFEIALQYSPKDAVLWYNQGMNYFHLKNFTEAIKNFDKALELRLNNQKVYLYKGQALEALGKITEAKECWRQAADFDQQT